MRLDMAAQAAKNFNPNNHSVLIYGPPKTGKTRYVATAAKLPQVKKIWWIDNENGLDTIMNMGLTDEELKKFTVFKIPDTKDNPRAIETVLKMLTSKTKLKICDAHGMVDCPECSKQTPYVYEEFLYSECKHDELIVIDSGSQLGVSALNFALLGKPALYKPQHDDWGSMGKFLSDALSVVQQCKYSNFVVITHELAHEGEDGKERLYPLMGTKPFSTNVGKYFGTVIYAHFGLGKHKLASSSTFKPNLITGSRLNVVLEKIEAPTMQDVLITGGVLK